MMLLFAGAGFKPAPAFLQAPRKMAGWSPPLLLLTVWEKLQDGSPALKLGALDKNPEPKADP
jgi:hypothetical protein